MEHPRLQNVLPVPYFWDNLLDTGLAIAGEWNSPPFRLGAGFFNLHQVPRAQSKVVGKYSTCFRSHLGLYVAPTYSHISDFSLWYAYEMSLRTSSVTGYRSVLEGCEIFRRWRLSEEVSMGDDVLEGFLTQVLSLL